MPPLTLPRSRAERRSSSRMSMPLHWQLLRPMASRILRRGHRYGNGPPSPVYRSALGRLELRRSDRLSDSAHVFHECVGYQLDAIIGKVSCKGNQPELPVRFGEPGERSSMNAMTLTLALITSQCGVIDDSNESGSGFLAQLTAPFIGVVGSVSGVTNNPLATTIPVAPDPLGSLTAPSPDIPGCRDSNGVAHLTTTLVTATTTLLPGTYCGGIHIQPIGAGLLLRSNRECTSCTAAAFRCWVPSALESRAMA